MRGRIANKKTTMLVCLALSIFIQGVVVGQTSSRSGVEKGWLILHGGGINKKRDFEHYYRFVELAGGPKASVVVILTPLDIDIITPDFLTKNKSMWTTDFGVGEVTLMDTRNRTEADTEAFVTPLQKATGVYIVGGHLSNLLNVYLGTRTEREIKAVAERGGVVAGSSAGAMIQGSFLVNVTKTPSDLRMTRSGMYLDKARTQGFGVLQGITVYPHFFVRKAEKDLFEVIARYPELVGIGIDENTAIILHGDEFEVIGEGKVGVFESKSAAQKKFVKLSRGQRFDLTKHSVIQ